MLWHAKKIEYKVFEVNKAICPTKCFYHFFLTIALQDMPPEEAKSFSTIPDEVTHDTVASLDEVKTYKQALTDLHDKGETPEVLDSYKQSVLNMLKLKSKSATT